MHTRLRNTPELLVALVGLGVATSLLGDATLYVILPTEYASAGLIATQVGIMLSANRLVRILINTPYGILMERLPRRWVVIPSLLLGGSASLLYTIPGFWSVLAGRILWGIGWVGIYIGATTIILDIATDANRGFLVGRFQMWTFVGIATSSALGGILYDAIGFANTFYVSAAVIGVWVLIWFWLLPETFSGTVESATADESNTDGNFRIMVTPLQFRLALAVYGLNWVIFLGAVVALLPKVVEARLGEEIAILGLVTLPKVSFTGMLTATTLVLSMALAPLSGRLTDRLGDRWGVLLGVMSIGGVSLVLLAIGDGLLIVLATLLNAFVTSVIMTQVTALVGDYARSQRGRRLGILNTIGDGGAAMGPLVALTVLPTFGLTALYGFMALMWVTALILIATAIRRQPKPLTTF